MEFRFPSGYGSTLLIVLLFILGSIYTYYPMSWKGTDEVNLEGEGYLKNTSELDNVLDHRFSPETRFLSAVTNGGLGNQMCSYAITYAMAKLTKRQGIIFPWTYKDLSRYFRITLPVILNETTWKCSGSAGTDWMSEEHYLLHSPCVVLSGYYQSWTFFHHAREDVIREFTFHDSYRLQAWRTLSELRGNRTRPTYVGVHVRRGDYIGRIWDAFRGTLADKGYIRRAMDYFRGRYTEVVFVVASDGMSWCKENINNSLGDVYFVGHGDPYKPGHDLALLAHCNHTIMTFGTFGFWAGYLAGGEVTYLANFTLPDSSWASSRPDQKQCLPDWIPIQANISYLYKKASSEATPQTTANATVTPVDETEKKGRLWERLKEMMRPVFR
ncbi:galactoside alpha-(1,2)-fucosyltransferase 2-like isoform X1 [Ornithodoros turicata]|uniref:galactoside alpha-(1,2)-fucosyltransferase 2-like isoform X1 n=1 Tax=Ornithodoros turicata TaxID=34597 RepID=UPI0031395A14